MFENLTNLLNFDPVLVGVFAGLSMMTVQMLKGLSQWIDDHAMVVVMAFSIFFATMIVYEVEEVLAVAILTFLIMSAASGIYSSSKGKTTVDLKDYSDES